ncbi:hypothetical protein N0V95_005918 [Ascochyta clinopodiicola]|nr:hypothetical protein N0V95_005918 [Ascochyta clinopodiicola]
MSDSTNTSSFAWCEIALFLIVAFIWVQTLLYVLRIVVEWQLAHAAQQQQRERRAALAAAAQHNREWLETMNGHRFETVIEAQEPAMPARRGTEYLAQLRRELEAALASLEHMDEQEKMEE